MKYTSPKIEIVSLEAEDVITASIVKFKIEETSGGEGKLSLNASFLF